MSTASAVTSVRSRDGRKPGGHNYAIRLNSTIKNNFIAEFSGGLHFQRANTIPTAIDKPLIADNFAVLKAARC